MSDPTPVRKCVCLNVAFETIHQMGLTSLQQIQEQLGCSTQCGTCLPYLKRMLSSGETAFAVLDPSTAEDVPYRIGRELQ